MDAVDGGSAADGSGSTPDGQTISGPLQLYEHRLAAEELRPDKNQLVVVQHLQKLSDELDSYKHQPRLNYGKLSEVSAVCRSLC